jgi:hypothetical protein
VVAAVVAVATRTLGVGEAPVARNLPTGGWPHSASGCRCLSASRSPDPTTNLLPTLRAAIFDVVT